MLWEREGDLSVNKYFGNNLIEKALQKIYNMVAIIANKILLKFTGHTNVFMEPLFAWWEYSHEVIWTKKGKNYFTLLHLLFTFDEIRDEILNRGFCFPRWQILIWCYFEDSIQFYFIFKFANISQFMCRVLERKVLWSQFLIMS